MPLTAFHRTAALAAILLSLGGCAAAPLHVAAVEQVSATTKTQGDFNLANQRALIVMDGRVVGEAEHTAGLQKIIMDRDTGRSKGFAREAGSGMATGRFTLQMEPDSKLAMAFAAWRKAALDGKTERKSISVIFHNDAGEEARINFYECWPVRWKAPEAIAPTGTHHIIEEIEFVVEKVERA